MGLWGNTLDPNNSMLFKSGCHDNSMEQTQKGEVQSACLLSNAQSRVVRA